MEHKSKILIYGRDPALLETRRKLLEFAGLDSYAVTQFEDAIPAIAEDHIGAVVLCSSLPEEEVSKALSSISQFNRGGVKTIVLTLPDTQVNLTGSVIALNAPVDPRRFIETLSRAINS